MTDEHLAQTCAELDQENARLHGELIDVRAELATAQHEHSSVEGHWAALEAENERLYQENQRMHARLDGAELEAAALARLMPLCACDFNPATTDGPQRECPVHGDGETFVKHVQRLERLLVAALAFREDRTGQMIHPQSPAMVGLRAALGALDGA